MQVQRIRTDPHSPNKFRVEGTLANIPEFATAFQCKEGTKVCTSLISFIVAIDHQTLLSSFSLFHSDESTKRAEMCFVVIDLV